MIVTKSLKPEAYIKPGIYEGRWSGYFVKVLLKRGIYTDAVEVNNGVRGINCKCEVEVLEDGYIIVR